GQQRLAEQRAHHAAALLGSLRREHIGKRLSHATSRPVAAPTGTGVGPSASAPASLRAAAALLGTAVSTGCPGTTGPAPSVIASYGAGPRRVPTGVTISAMPAPGSGRRVISIVPSVVRVRMAPSGPGGPAASASPSRRRNSANSALSSFPNADSRDGLPVA